jgi:hypothetical protein
MLPFLHRLSRLALLRGLCLGDLGAEVDGGDRSWSQLPLPPRLEILDLSKRVTVRPESEGELVAAAVAMPSLRTLVLSATRPTGLWDTALLYGIAVRYGRHEACMGRSA